MQPIKIINWIRAITLIQNNLFGDTLFIATRVITKYMNSTENPTTLTQPSPKTKGCQPTVNQATMKDTPGINIARANNAIVKADFLLV